MVFQKKIFLKKFINFKNQIIKKNIFLKKNSMINITALYIYIIFRKAVLFIYYFNRQLKGISISILKKIIVNYGYNENILLQLVFHKHIFIILKILNELKAEERKIFLQTRLINFQTIKNYKGKRHLKGFPSNGQRTSTNAHNAKIMISLIQNLNKFI